MKTISLWQPWATLVSISAKQIETRSWQTSYRGPLAIHAALHWTKEIGRMCLAEPFRTPLLNFGFCGISRRNSALPFGAVVCVCRLVDCRFISRTGMGTTRRYSAIPDEPERSFGNYAPGRYAWILEDIQPLDRPIPFTGSQGFFEVPDNLLSVKV